MIRTPGLISLYGLGTAKKVVLFVAMAAYGEYGPGYIGTEIAYSQGGYETGPTASSVSPEVEGVLMAAMEKLLSD